MSRVVRWLARPCAGRRRPQRLRHYFDHNPGRLLHKWEHYFPIYERHFAPFRGRRPTVLEIGVSHGGSLQMWQHYFGKGAHIVGMDIEPRVAQLAEPGISIVVGDQSDDALLQRVAAQHGPFDIVIDDGSHMPAHQLQSIESLWPHVKVGGVYLVEDLHTSYWPEGYGGGLGVPSTFIEWIKPRIDDINAYHSREAGFEVGDWTRSLGGLHIYDSIAVFDKADVPAPVVRMTGTPAFDDVYGIDVNEIERGVAPTPLGRKITLARLRRAITNRNTP